MKPQGWRWLQWDRVRLVFPYFTVFLWFLVISSTVFFAHQKWDYIFDNHLLASSVIIRRENREQTVACQSSSRSVLYSLSYQRSVISSTVFFAHQKSSVIIRRYRDGDPVACQSSSQSRPNPQVILLATKLHWRVHRPRGKDGDSIKSYRCDLKLFLLHCHLSIN